MPDTRQFLLICAAALLLSACGRSPAPDYSTPDKAFATLVRAVNNEDNKAFADCFVTAEQPGMLKSSLDPEVDGVTLYDEVRAGPVHEKGGFHVGMEEYWKDGKKVTEQPIAFVKENGQWKASWDKAAEYREKYAKPAE
jgi:hypothetical protein